MNLIHPHPAPMRALIPVLLLALAAFWAAPRTLAQAPGNPPERMTYQGFLADGNGEPLGNTNTGPRNYDIIFRILGSQTGGPTNWTEQQTVTVDRGNFSVLLGEGTPVGIEPHPALSSLFATNSASDRYVEMTVKGIGAAGADVTILPRLRLLTSPYAFLATTATKAMSVDASAVTSGRIGETFLSTNVALLNRSPQHFTGTNTFAGRVGIGTTTPSRPLTVNGTGDTGIQLVNTTSGKNYAVTTLDDGRFLIKDEQNGSLQFWMNKVNSTFSLNGGNVGIGTTNPAARLHVSGGNLRLDSDALITFADNGQIRSSDDNHRILFRRGDNKLELREFGDIIFSPGASSGNETAKAVILANGNMGVGTNSPQAKLHVAGAGHFLGSTPYVKFADAKAKNTEGGTANAGSNFRVFTTNWVSGLSNGTNWVSPLTTSRTNITLPPGTYQCRISVPGYRVNQHQARLRIAGGDTLIYGTTEYANDGDVIITRSLIDGQFTLSSSSSLVVEHNAKEGNADNGLGTRVNASWTDANAVEIYTVAEFWKLQ